MREITMVEAVNEALREEMRRDERVYLIGEDVGPKGRTMARVGEGFWEEFGEMRVRETGIIETLIAGSSVGAALAGMRPVADFLLSDFMFPALDEILAKAGIWRYEHGGNDDMRIPVVFHARFGGYGGAGAEHSRAPTGLFMHAPGLKIAIPTTPYDAKGLLKTAIRDDNPVIFLEHRLLDRARGPVPEEEYLVPFGVAHVRREGQDVTIVATGYQVALSLQAAEDLEREGISAEVIDPRTLEPLDIEAIIASVKKTGRLVVVDEDFLRCSVGAEIGFQVQERVFDALKAPIRRVGNPNVPHPVSPTLVRAVLPNREKIAAAARETF